MVAPLVAPHPVLLRSASFGGTPADGHLILERTDPEFIPAILDELARPGGTAALMRTQARTLTGDRVLKLFQPVQRTFNVALFEVACDVPGTPRFDPARIESAGMVVRRISRDHKDVPHLDEVEAWCQDGHAIRGWVRLATPEEIDRDPDAARRPAPSAGHGAINQRLAIWRGVTQRLSETVTPLFPAPPEVCRALGKTILFGVIPVASAEVSEASGIAEASGTGTFAPREIGQRLSVYLKEWPSVVVPCAEAWLTRADADDRELKPWINMLRQLVYELDAFGESPKSRALFAALEKIHVPLEKPVLSRAYLKKHPEYYRSIPNRTAGELLRQHAEVLVLRSSEPERRRAPWPKYPKVQMPPAWPYVTEAQAAEVATAARDSLEARLTALVRPRRPRFDQRPRPPAKPGRNGRSVGARAPFSDTGEMYKLRAFVRVRHHEHCPPHTVWSEHSQEFTIAPWYEGTGAPPVQIALPDPTDKNFLKSLRPNVAFAVPGSLFKLLENNDPKKLLQGKGSSGPPSEPAWLCGFNIPIITICAFILLCIILVILHLLFWWLPFVKICIPYPRSRP